MLPNNKNTKDKKTKLERNEQKRSIFFPSISEVCFETILHNTINLENTNDREQTTEQNKMGKTNSLFF